MSVAPAPVVSPRPGPGRPDLVPARSKRPGPSGLWIGLIVALAMVGGALLYQQRNNKGSSPAPAMTSLRTAKVAPGAVERTVRLTGVTAAANFVSLVTPQLRGSRTDKLRDASASSTTTASSSSSTSATSASGSSTATSGSGSTTASSSSAPDASSAFQSATSRFGGTLRGSAAATSSSKAGSATQSATMGPNGLGTAADSLPGGAGGGGGGGDFQLVLQDVVAPGARVKKGQQVAEFDRQYMLLRLEDYRSSVRQSEDGMKTRKANLTITRNAHDQLIASAKADLDKAKLDLKTIPVLSAIDAERAKLAVEQAEAKYKQLLAEVKWVQTSQDADIRNSELDLEQGRVELKRAETNTEKMLVKAPIDGIAVMQSIFRGGDFGQIQKGDQLWPGMFFMQVVDPSSMVINSSVNQVDVENLRIGSKAKVRFDAYPGLELPAHVDSIAAVTKPGGFRANFVREVPVRLRIDKMDPRVIPDLSVSADVLIEAESSAAATVPAGAVFEEGKLRKTYVMVQSAAGWEQRPVEVGVRNYVLASIKSGLRPGEVVALDRPHPAEEQP